MPASPLRRATRQRIGTPCAHPSFTDGAMQSRRSTSQGTSFAFTPRRPRTSDGQRCAAPRPPTTASGSCSWPCSSARRSRRGRAASRAAFRADVWRPPRRQPHRLRRRLRALPRPAGDWCKEPLTAAGVFSAAALSGFGIGLALPAANAEMAEWLPVVRSSPERIRAHGVSTQYASAPLI